MLALTILAAVPATASAADVWLRVRFTGATPTEILTAAALNAGGRPGLVIGAGDGRAYPLPGYVPVWDEELEAGLPIAADRDRLDRPGEVLTLSRVDRAQLRLTGRAEAVPALLPAKAEAPMLLVELPVGLLGRILPPADGGREAAAAARRDVLAGNPADGGRPRQYVRAGWSAGLRAAVPYGRGGSTPPATEPAPAAARPPTAAWRVEPGTGRLVPDVQPQALAAINLGANLADRWRFSSVPEGATITFAGIPDRVSTDVAIRNLSAPAVRSMVMSKEGFEDCRHHNATLDVVVRNGLEWNSVRCVLERRP